jgi:Tol biopolymer transport system component
MMRRLFLRVAMLLCLFAVAQAFIVRGDPLTPPDPDWVVVYRANTAEPPYIITRALHLASGRIETLTWQGRHLVNHACALDGRALAFVTQDEALFVASLSGAVRALNAPQRLSEADIDLSSGAGRIAYSIQGTACCGTFILDVATGGVVKLQDGFYHSFSPSFARDGEQLALAADATRFTPHVYGLYVAESASPVFLAEGTGPQWSPVGDVLAMNGIALVDVRTRLRVSLSSENDLYPAWSPDGQSIVYLAYQSRQYDLAMMHWDGTGVRLLTNSREMEHEACFMRQLPQSLVANSAVLVLH